MGRTKKTAEKVVSKIINIQELFGTEKGEEVLFHLCKTFHYFDSSYQGDVNDCLFREGERNVMNYIMAQLQKNPALLMLEYRKRLKEELTYEEEN